MSDTPVVVQAALAGPGGGDGFATPVTDDEVVADALVAWDAGAALIYLPARRPDGTASRPERLARLIERIRSGGCDAILALSGAALGDLSDCLRLRPELVSLDLRDGDRELEQDGPLRAALAEVRSSGIPVEVRCHDLAHVQALLRLHGEGLLDDPLRAQLVIPQDAADPIEHALLLSSLLPAEAVWSVSGAGAAQLRLNVLCLIAGGHVRTGLEDNVWLVEGIPATNRELVQRIVRVVDELDRPLATPEEAREILGLGGPAHAPFGDARPPAPLRAVDLRVAAG